MYKDSVKETTEVHCLFAKCRDLVSLFHRSSKATGVLQLQCNLLFTESCNSRLVQDIPTRWNSTLLMISSLIQLKEQVMGALGALMMPNLALSELEWCDLTGIIRPFEQVTSDLSSQFHPSVSKVSSDKLHGHVLELI